MTVTRGQTEICINGFLRCDAVNPDTERRCRISVVSHKTRNRREVHKTFGFHFSEEWLGDLVTPRRTWHTLAKVHAIGAQSGSGHHRTLCDYYMATGPYAVKTTDAAELVTCKACLKVAT